MSSFDFTHFNPGLQPEKDFLSAFIARQDTLSFILKQLTNTGLKSAGRHLLIVAPRGYGKTSLLRRIRIAVRDVPELRKRYVALSFREEQHNVISLDIFWQNCLFSLLESLEDENVESDVLIQLDRQWKQLGARHNLKREEQDGELGWAALSQYCSSIKRRPVLLIDNLDIFLSGLPETHQWTLRSILQRADGPIIIGAASRFPEAINDIRAPFYDFFRISALKSLDDREAMDCLYELAKRRGEKGLAVQEMLLRDPGRITSLNTMAGGNPRTLGVLYTVLESHMSDDVVAQLTAMLDTFTGWYQARTEELKPKLRAVFDALALNWDPMTVAALAKITGLDKPSITESLSTLEKTGFAETTATSSDGKNKAAYQVSERFFNIWYLMRNGSRHTRQKIRFLTIFLRYCFSSTELYRMAKSKLEVGNADSESVLALAACIGDIDLRSKLVESASQDNRYTDEKIHFQTLVADLYKTTLPKKNIKSLKKFKDLFEKVINLLKENQSAEAEATARQAIDIAPGAYKHAAWYALATTLDFFSHRYEEAAEAYRQSLALEPNQALTWSAYGGLLHDHLKKSDEALSAAQEAIKIDEKNSAAWFLTARLLGEKTDSLPQAEYAYRRTLELTPDHPIAGSRLAKILLRQNKDAEAETIYRKVVEQRPDDGMAWSELALLIQKDKARMEEAEKIHERAIELDEESSGIWNNFGTFLSRRSYFDRAAEAYRNAIRVDSENSAAWTNLSRILPLMQRFDEAEDANRRLIELQPKNPLPWVRLGFIYQSHLKRYEEAENFLRKAIAIDSSYLPAWSLLAILLNDYVGDFKGGVAALNEEIRLTKSEEVVSMCNKAFAYALGLRDIENAKITLGAITESLSKGAVLLIEAAIAWAEDAPEPSIIGWQLLDEAFSISDDNFWSNNTDDVERILAFTASQGTGSSLRSKMVERNYDDQFAPLYYAFVAALEGEDFLNTVNPEVRSAAIPIFERISRFKHLYKSTSRD